MPSATFTETPLYVRVAEVRQEAEKVRSYRLKALDGSALPPFSAGAHVGVHLPLGTMRFYSLCSSPLDLSSYMIGVHRQDDGRQGSQIIHESFQPGRIVKLKPPRNSFPLAPGKLHVLAASGIGITPFLSMMDELDDRGTDYRLVFSARSLKETPFSIRLLDLQARGKADLYIGDLRAGRPDFVRLFAETHREHHLYVCGSEGFMARVRAATCHWSRSNFHSESFSGPASVTGETEFTVETKRSGKIVRVGADETLLAALRSRAIEVDSVCENGTCGTCKVRYLAGEPEHRDSILTRDEKQQFIVTCVSRSTGSMMILDV